MPRKSKALEKKYTGTLATSIKIPGLPKQALENPGKFIAKQFGANPNHFEKTENNPVGDVSRQMLEKIVPLLKHFGIGADDENRWFLLALNLAVAHVPGFSVEETNIRANEIVWNAASYARLYCDVQTELANKKNGRQQTLGEVCKTLIRSDRWHGYGLKALRNNYSKSLTSELVEMFFKVEKAGYMNFTEFKEWIEEFDGRVNN